MSVTVYIELIVLLIHKVNLKKSIIFLYDQEVNIMLAKSMEQKLLDVQNESDWSKSSQNFNEKAAIKKN